MARRRLNKEDREELQFDGVMRLVEGIMLHVLDNVSISGKWYPKDISMKTLLAKRELLVDMRKWMKTWQWNIWVNLYSQYFNHNNHLIKRKFESIRKKSISYVNKRIKKKLHEEAQKSKTQDDT